MFKVVVSDTSLFKDSIDTVGQIIGEGIFNITNDGIELKATDRAMVAVVDLKLHSKGFDVFQVEKPGKIAVSIENLLQILKRAKGNDKIELEVSGDNSKLSVRMLGDSVRKFSIPLLDISENEIPDVNKLEFSTSVKIKTSSLEEGIDDAYILSDALLFKTDGSTLTMKTDGNSSTSEMVVDKEGGLVSVDGEASQARYPLEYLKKMMKGGKISPLATISFGKDFPMKLDFVSPEKCTLSFVLAPRVEE